MASAELEKTEASSELEKKEAAGEEADNNPEEPMEEEDDENDDGGDDGDVEEDVVVQIGATYSCRRQDGTYHDAEIVKTRKSKQADGEEEYFVHYVGLNRRQNEWVGKTQLVIPKPVKEEQTNNSTEPEPAEDGKAAQKRKNDDDGAPEAKKVKVDVESPPTTNSAAASGDFAEELTCLLCSELFKDPVMVECGHNFCRNCIDKAWNDQESFTCPDCKEVITEKRHTTNRALANLVKKTVGTTATRTPAKPTTEKPKLAENCPEHDERLKLYCKDDGILSCVICRDSLKHASHNFLPILDAVGVYRTELSSIVAPLEESLKVTEQLTTQQSENVEQHKANVSESRQHIVSEFEKVRSFLKEQQEKLLEQLQEQGENLLKEMEENQVKMQENQDNIKQTISMANEKMNDTDSISFLTGIKSFIEKCQEEQQNVMVSGNTLLSKDLCQGTFKGPIQYSVWKKMKSFIAPCRLLNKLDERLAPNVGALLGTTLTPLSTTLLRMGSDSRTARKNERWHSPVQSRHAAMGPTDMQLREGDAAADGSDSYFVRARTLPQTSPTEVSPGLQIPGDDVSGHESKNFSADGKTVWIIGDSIIHGAQVRAAELPHGTQLGFTSDKCRIFWFSQRDLDWTGVSQLVMQAAKKAPPPDFLIIHAGRIDVMRCPPMELVSNIKWHVNRWLAKWPGLMVIWSKIIGWKCSDGVSAEVKKNIGKTIKSVNKLVRRHLVKRGGSSVNHSDIYSDRDILYSADGGNLSTVGLDLFNKNLQKKLEECLQGVNIFGEDV